MAEKFFSISVGHGADPRAVAIGNTTTGAPIELRVEVTASGVDKTVIYNALGTLRDSLMRQSWPIA